MNIFRIPAAIACAAFLVSGPAVAGEIYKWVDEDGNVHYEDRPIGKTDVELMSNSWQIYNIAKLPSKKISDDLNVLQTHKA